MTAPVGTPLARVTVASPQRRIDVALPEDVPLAELLPTLLAHAGESAADDGERHGGWTLRRATGTVLDPGRALNVQGIQDGEVLRLAPARTEWPEIEYDDVVEAIADGARRYGRSWGRAATRRAGLVTFCGIFAVGLVVILLCRSPWALPGAVALGVAAALAISGIALSRAMADAVAGSVVAGCALPYAFTGGLLVAGPAHASLLGFGAPQVLLASACLLACSVVGYVGVSGRSRMFAGGLMAGLLGILGGLLGLTSIQQAGVAGIVLTVALCLLPSYPLLAIRLGKLPVPELPQQPSDMLKDVTQPARSAIFDAVARADEILTGLLFGVGLVSAPCVVLLVGSGHVSAVVLVLDAALALLLRARLFPTARQRIPLLLAGGGALALPLVLLAAAGGNTTRMVLVVVVLVMAAFVLVAGLVFSRRAPSPYLGRTADVVDVLAIIALIPIASIIAGLYGYVQDMFSSVV